MPVEVISTTWARGPDGSTSRIRIHDPATSVLCGGERVCRETRPDVLVGRRGCEPRRPCPAHKICVRASGPTTPTPWWGLGSFRHNRVSREVGRSGLVAVCLERSA